MNLPDLPNGYAWRLCGADGVTTLALAVWTGPRCRYGLGRIYRRGDTWRAEIHDSGGMPMWFADHPDPYTAWRAGEWGIRDLWSRRRPAERHRRTFDSDHSRPATTAHHITARHIGERHAAHARTCTDPTCGLRPRKD